MTNTADLRLGDYLGHILEAIERINRYTADLDRAGFESTERIQDAVIRNFEIIGEAARNIERRYPEFAREHTNVPWRFAYECAMPSHMAISKWTWVSPGTRLKPTYRGLQSR